MSYSINIIALIIGTLVNMGLGALWYSPVLFAKVWMQESGVSPEQVQGSQGMMGKIYGATAFGALLTAFAIGFLMENMGVTSLVDVFIVAAIIWLGLDLPNIIKNWGFEGRTIKLGFINHGYNFCVYILVSFVFVLMK